MTFTFQETQPIDVESPDQVLLEGQTAGETTEPVLKDETQSSTAVVSSESQQQQQNNSGYKNLNTQSLHKSKKDSADLICFGIFKVIIDCI